MQKQEQSEWCWAAVALSIEKYFNSKSTLTQSEIARKVLEKTTPGLNFSDVASYNVPAKLSDALRAIGRLRGNPAGRVRFDEISGEIDARRPVCARIQWNGGSSHFVVFAGYEVLRSGARHAIVADPRFPDSMVDFDEFQDSYHGDGKWVETFFVTNPPTKWEMQTNGESALIAKKTDATDECLPALHTGLDDFFDSGDKPAASLPQNHEVLPVYSLGLDKFADEPQRTLRGLNQVGWRFIGTGPASSLGCHIGRTKNLSLGTEHLSFIGAARNQDIANLLDWFHQVVKGAAQKLDKEKYEVRALRIPGLLIEAFWVYCPNSDNDYVVPIAGSISGSIPRPYPKAAGPNQPDRNLPDDKSINWNLKPMQLYSAEEFFRAVGEAARYKLQKDKELHGPANGGERAQGAD